MTAKKTILIGIGGASSSGKTTIAKILHLITENSILLHQDDYYKNDSEIPVDKETGFVNWDCAEALNFDAFKKELKYIKEHGDFSPQSKRYENRYNSDTNDQNIEGVSQDVIVTLRSKIDDLFKERNIRVAYVDGFLLHHDPEIIKLFDLNIFLVASYETLKTRRDRRNGYQTQETFWVDPPKYFEKIVYPAYKKAHSYLFVDGDVEKTLDPEQVKDLGIISYQNNDNTSLTDLLQKCFDDVFAYISNV